MARALKDARRFIITEIVHTQGVELVCLDCSNSADRSYSMVVASWEDNAGPLFEIITAAEEHEEKFH